MEWVKNIFVNTAENRARMFWRISVQLGLFVLFSFLASIVLTFAYRKMADVEAGASVSQSQLMEFVVNNLYAMSLYTLLTGGAICVSVWVAIRIMDRRRIADYGLNLSKRWWEEFWFGILVGGGLIALVFGFELAAGWITVDAVLAGSPGKIVAGLTVLAFNFIFVGFYEEFISRGYHLTNFAQGFRGILGARGSILLGMVLSAGIFGIAHIGNPEATVMTSVNIMVVGVILLGLGYVFTGRLAIPIGMHITWNFFQGAVFGFPVSGRTGSWAKVFTITQHGNPVWTGGKFGPEGGLIGTIAVLIGAGVIIWWLKYKDGKVGLATEIARYEQTDEL
ncbi:MAG: CPBP family intramembrane metalloprotease [Candidatus Marinimicrobia bacterium]|nr:CPBP family intramembrane metalloprotease [Candidatus Neomarinimicrobiota bacterium]MCF7828599.1 CPBP family intramembrane metalloprotease [Candidatus Neomarinimicrobiota bacterium]MCF7880340.1 CPBP family intramembrane metalloprotease [Candidatus Neomarinimicrobiota bacterium]